MYQFDKNVVLLIIAVIYILPIESTHHENRLNATKLSMESVLSENGEIAPGAKGYAGNIVSLIFKCFHEATALFDTNAPKSALYAKDVQPKLNEAVQKSREGLLKYIKDVAGKAMAHDNESSVDFILDYCLEMERTVDEKIKALKELFATETPIKAIEEWEKEEAEAAAKQTENDEKEKEVADDLPNGKNLPSDSSEKVEEKSVPDDGADNVEETSETSEAIEETSNDTNNQNTITNEEDNDLIEDEIINSVKKAEDEPEQNDDAEESDDTESVLEGVDSNQINMLLNMQEKLRNLTMKLQEKVKEGNYDEETKKKVEELSKLNRDEL